MSFCTFSCCFGTWIYFKELPVFLEDISCLLFNELMCLELSRNWVLPDLVFLVNDFSELESLLTELSLTLSLVSLMFIF